VKLAAGLVQTGQREVVVSKSIRDRFTHAGIGDTMEFGKGRGRSWEYLTREVRRMNPKCGAT
jgi:hypothetical protein